jgi:predicted Zn-dependent protease
MRVFQDRGLQLSAPRNVALCGGILAIALAGAAQGVKATEAEEIAAQLKTAASLHERADYLHSIPILKHIVQLSPRNYPANLMLGEDLLRSGKPQDALAPLRTASESRPDDVVALDFTVAAAEAVGDSALESEALEEAVARSGGDERHLLVWANFCLHRFHALEAALLATKQGEGVELRISAWGNPEGSETRESLLEQSAAADPEQRGIWGELGIAQLELDKHAQAQKSLEEAERREAHEAATLRLEALFAAAESNWQLSEERLRALGARSPAELAKALAAWPANLTPGAENTGAVWNCIRGNGAACPLPAAPTQGGEGLGAKDLYAEGRWEQLKALPAAAAADREEWLWRGVAQARTGDCLRAIPALERGLQANQRDGSFYLQVCYASEEQRCEGRLGEAGNQGALHELKGDSALGLRNDPAAAQKEYAEAVRSRPKDARLLARLAEVDRMLGESEQARASAQSALAVDPSQASAMQTLAQLAMSERQYAEALLRLKQLAALLPRDAWIQVELGIAHGELGHADEAVRFLAPQLASGYPDPKGALHAQLAAALRKLGRMAEAGQAAAEAARLANASLESSEREKSEPQ